MLKGAMHIHSTYSDGEWTLKELREQFVDAGCSFACVTDHAEAFDSKKLRQYTDECEGLSDDDFCYIPGLEYQCERRMHILSFGLVVPTNTQNPEKVIQEIEERGGISVIAHPQDNAFDWIESFSVLPKGIEAWNTKYDGRYAPRAGTFKLIARLRERNTDLLAFYGLDLHWRRQCRRLFTFVWTDLIDRVAILDDLRHGKYHGVNSAAEFPSNGRIAEDRLERFELVQRRSALLRRIFRSAKNAADHVGLRVPNAVKSRLRRIL